jgi:hypothetical protein
MNVQNGNSKAGKKEEETVRTADAQCVVQYKIKT